MIEKKILMPKLGESVTEGTINTWLVDEGDYIEKYEPIAEVTTDKVNAEIPSSYNGKISKIVAQAGETVAVNDLICYIETEEDETEMSTTPTENTKSKNKDSQSPTETMEDRNIKRKRYSPAVMRLAQEHKIDLSSVTGTGMGGRITRKDLLNHIEKGINLNKPAESVDKSDHKIEKNIETPLTSTAHDKEIAVSAIRKTIAENMVRSKQEIPHAWMTIEVDVTDIVAMREKIKEEFQKNEGYPLTYFPFFIYAVASALKEYPALNSMWAGDKIIEKRDIHISIAVATEDELYVPVIKDAGHKNILGIAKSIYDLANKTRNGKLTQEDIRGGTFTVNNTGIFGSISSMGIINHPQAAILQVESIVKRPVIIDNMFAARDMVNLSLSLDHRILDGLVCGRFLARVKEILENMNEKTINI